MDTRSGVVGATACSVALAVRGVVAQPGLQTHDGQSDRRSGDADRLCEGIVAAGDDGAPWRSEQRRREGRGLGAALRRIAGGRRHTALGGGQADRAGVGEAGIVPEPRDLDRGAGRAQRRDGSADHEAVAAAADREEEGPHAAISPVPAAG